MLTEGQPGEAQLWGSPSPCGTTRLLLTVPSPLQVLGKRQPCAVPAGPTVHSCNLPSREAAPPDGTVGTTHVAPPCPRSPGVPSAAPCPSREDNTTPAAAPRPAGQHGGGRGPEERARRRGAVPRGRAGARRRRGQRGARGWGSRAGGAQGAAGRAGPGSGSPRRVPTCSRPAPAAAAAPALRVPLPPLPPPPLGPAAECPARPRDGPSPSARPVSQGSARPHGPPSCLCAGRHGPAWVCGEAAAGAVPPHGRRRSSGSAGRAVSVVPPEHRDGEKQLAAPQPVLAGVFVRRRGPARLVPGCFSC